MLANIGNPLIELATSPAGQALGHAVLLFWLAAISVLTGLYVGRKMTRCCVRRHGVRGGIRRGADTRRAPGGGARYRVRMRTRLALAVLLVGLLAGAPARATPRRLERPVAVTGGVSIFGAVEGDEALPFLTLQLVWNRWARLAAVADASYFSTGDRMFGPRLVARGGARWYLVEGAAAPFVAGHAALYHQWDVDYPYSDASQVPGTAVGGGASIGHELALTGGFTWTFEGTLMSFVLLDGDAPDGASWQIATTFGYRF